MMIAAMLLCASVGMAQNDRDNQTLDKNAKMMRRPHARFTVAMADSLMIANLGLDEKQAAKVRKLNKKYASIIEGSQPKMMGSRPSGNTQQGGGPGGGRGGMGGGMPGGMGGGMPGGMGGGMQGGFGGGQMGGPQGGMGGPQGMLSSSSNTEDLDAKQDKYDKKLKKMLTENQYSAYLKIKPHFYAQRRIREFLLGGQPQLMQDEMEFAPEGPAPERPGGQGGPGQSRESVGSKSETGYSQTAGDATENGTYTSTKSDENAVQVTGGTLNLRHAVVKKLSGDTQDPDGSSFYGTNSAVYVSGEGSVVNMDGGSIASDAVGVNAGFACKGGTLNISNVSIHNTKDLSRGIHATGGGIINARNLQVLTEGNHSSVVATDRGGGTVKVNGGNYTCTGVDCAVLYSTGDITADNISGFSKQGEMGVIEGNNSITINNSDLTSGDKRWGMMILQSGSGDSEGYNGKIFVNDSRLSLTDAEAPLCEVPTNITGTLTLKDVNLQVPSKILMRVEYNSRWTTKGGTGHLILKTDSEKTYEGTVCKDAYGHVNVLVGRGVTWKLSADTALDHLTVEQGSKVITNGYKLKYATADVEGEVR